jgi:hypothetical protein
MVSQRTECRKLDCPECSLPAGRIINGALVFTARHHGQKHEVVVSLDTLRKMLTQSEKSVLDSAVMAS